MDILNMMEIPNHLYKFRSYDGKSVNNLFNRKMVFSSRTNFNDIFDSKVEIKIPTESELAGLYLSKGGMYTEYLSSIIRFGKYTADGLRHLENKINIFNSVIDSYPMLCLSRDVESILLWSHYGDSHKGFCIEFKSNYIAAMQVKYQKNLPKIDLLRFLENKDLAELGAEIHESIRTKLDHWMYEQEYRYLPDESIVPRLRHGEKYTLVEYPADFVNSIIFGRKCDPKHKNYIIKNLPYKVQFKEMVEDGCFLRVKRIGA